MSKCDVNNGSSVYCEYGCCGESNNQYCCKYELSETVIIVACIVGALVIAAIAVVLIICINSKQKDMVTRIRPRQRSNFLDGGTPPRRAIMPKPPPYSEPPPEYNSWMTSETPSTYSAYPGATDYDYNSVSRSNSNYNPRHSPHPSTSGSRRHINVNNSNRHVDLQSSAHSRRANVPKHNRRRNNTIQGQENPASGNIHIQSNIDISVDNSPTLISTGAHQIDDRQELLPGQAPETESPEPQNPTAAVRSAHRREALQRLQNRQLNNQFDIEYEL